MGYLHIDNLYKNQAILLHEECYALEKIHGTSARVSWKNGRLTFHAGGEKHDRFAALFDQERLTAAFRRIAPNCAATVYGEAYGGKQQAQSWRYGPDLRFVAFDVMLDGDWLSVPSAAYTAELLGLEFVWYRRVSTLLSSLDAERDAPSEQARRNGVVGDKPREGVVLRPLTEAPSPSGERLIAKHKRDEERETKTPRRVVDPAEQAVLDDAVAIADEWVTMERLRHVLDKMPAGVGVEQTRDVIAAMVDDVLREGRGEIVDSKAARAAIGRNTAQLFKRHLNNQLRGTSE